MLRLASLLLFCLTASLAVAAENERKEQKLGFGKPKAAATPLRFEGKKVASSSSLSVDQRWAQGYLEDKDSNQDRALTEQEIDSSKVEKYDKNKDGRVVIDELVAFGQGDTKDKNFSSLRAIDKKVKSYRLKTPAEKLPEGLPGWFAQRDSNGDGQVAMHEWSRTWSDYTAREFTSKDGNDDGIITIDEALKSSR